MEYCSLFYIVFEELLKTLCNIYLHGQPYRVLLCNQIVLLTKVGFLSPFPSARSPIQDLKSSGGFMVDSAFHLFEVDEISTMMKEFV